MSLLSSYANASRRFAAEDLVSVAAEECRLTLFKAFQERFPITSDLLSRASVEQFVLQSTPYLLLAWRSARTNSLCGWVCASPVGNPPGTLHASHAEYLKTIGGILDYWGETHIPLLVNQREVLTCRLAAAGIDPWLQQYPVTEIEHEVSDENAVVISEEYNGNIAFYLRDSGEVIYLAPDHCDPSLVPYRDYPEFTFAVRDTTPCIFAFIEELAKQWSNALA